MPCHRSAGYAVGPAAGPDSCSPTAATTSTATGSGYKGAASPRASPGAAKPMVLGWARCAGSSNAGFAWLHGFTRLRTRDERRADIHLGLLQLACALICHRQLIKSF